MLKDLGSAQLIPTDVRERTSGSFNLARGPNPNQLSRQHDPVPKPQSSIPLPTNKSRTPGPAETGPKPSPETLRFTLSLSDLCNLSNLSSLDKALSSPQPPRSSQTLFVLEVQDDELHRQQRAGGYREDPGEGGEEEGGFGGCGLGCQGV